MSEEAMTHDTGLPGRRAIELRRMIGVMTISPAELPDAYLIFSTGPARMARAFQRFNR
ncbi:hypothetical protein [Paraburkholderia caledonica]|jgi:hypothetical protein|uniref:hypothetical protein n=1 Tax=Paraburkholderia caledonica TaxID=134536 RepID=UPI0038B732E3